MKISLNTEQKIIKLEEQVNLGELFTFLEEILPNLKWREYSIEVNVVKTFYKNTPLWAPPFTPYTKIGGTGNPYEVKYTSDNT